MCGASEDAFISRTARDDALSVPLNEPVKHLVSEAR
jgi:hypothetical protein